jgi:hypothetical protein
MNSSIPEYSRKSLVPASWNNTATTVKEMSNLCACLQNPPEECLGGGRATHLCILPACLPDFSNGVNALLAFVNGIAKLCGE